MSQAQDGNEAPKISIAELIEGCVGIEMDLALPHGCLVDLPSHESDWSFVIKLAALVESAVSHMLIDEINDGRVRSLITRLPMQGVIGKLNVAKSWDLLSSNDFAFAVGISTLRNTVAHDPSWMGFKFSVYVEGLERNRRLEFYRWAARGIEHQSADESAIKLLRFQMWAQACVVLLKARITKTEAAAKRRQADAYKELAESFLNSPPNS